MKSTHMIDGRRCSIETTAQVETKDTTITTVVVSWIHGIYKTHEEARFTMVSDALGNDHLVFADGTIVDGVVECMSEGRNAQLCMAIGNHITDEYCN